MFKHLQQRDDRFPTAGRLAGLVARSVQLKANFGLLLALVLIIIPTISGAALIT